MTKRLDNLLKYWYTIFHSFIFQMMTAITTTMGHRFTAQEVVVSISYTYTIKYETIGLRSKFRWTYPSPNKISDWFLYHDRSSPSIAKILAIFQQTTWRLKRHTTNRSLTGQERAVRKTRYYSLREWISVCSVFGDRIVILRTISFMIRRKYKSLQNQDAAITATVMYMSTEYKQPLAQFLALVSIADREPWYTYGVMPFALSLSPIT